MELFTIEEINLLCIYNTETRQTVLADLTTALPDIYDLEMREIVERTIAKLKAMTDMEIAPGLIPADEYIDGEGD